MNKEKQIEEMAEDIRRTGESYYGRSNYLTAKALFDDGYRKINPKEQFVVTADEISGMMDISRQDAAAKIFVELMQLFPRDKSYTTISRSTVKRIMRQFGLEVVE